MLRDIPEEKRKEVVQIRSGLGVLDKDTIEEATDYVKENWDNLICVTLQKRIVYKDEEKQK